MAPGRTGRTNSSAVIEMSFPIDAASTTRWDFPPEGEEVERDDHPNLCLGFLVSVGLSRADPLRARGDDRLYHQHSPDRSGDRPLYRAAAAVAQQAVDRAARRL